MHLPFTKILNCTLGIASFTVVCYSMNLKLIIVPPGKLHLTLHLTKKESKVPRGTRTSLRVQSQACRRALFDSKARWIGLGAWGTFLFVWHSRMKTLRRSINIVNLPVEVLKTPSNSSNNIIYQTKEDGSVKTQVSAKQLTLVV